MLSALALCASLDEPYEGVVGHCSVPGIGAD